MYFTFTFISSLLSLHTFWCAIPTSFYVCFFFLSHIALVIDAFICEILIMLTLLAEFPHAVQLVDFICMRRVRFAGNVVVRGKFC